MNNYDDWDMNTGTPKVGFGFIIQPAWKSLFETYLGDLNREINKLPDLYEAMTVEITTQRFSKTLWEIQESYREMSKTLTYIRFIETHMKECVPTEPSKQVDYLCTETETYEADSIEADEIPI